MNFFNKKFLNLERAVLATLIYSNLFSYPLTAKEVWLWLPQRARLKKVYEQLNFLVEQNKIGYQSPFYFLKQEKEIISGRLKRELVSDLKIVKAKLIGQRLASLPWVGMVAISGNLAMRAAEKKDDIDLMIIGLPGALFRARMASILLTELLGLRRRPEKKEAPDKICLNLFLESNNLNLPQKRRDFYTAHEALQLLPVAGDKKLYQQFLLDNSWLANYLPQIYQKRLGEQFLTQSPTFESKKTKSSWLEKVLMAGQLAYAKQHRRLIESKDRQLFFHPQDQRQRILTRFEKDWEAFFGSKELI